MSMNECPNCGELAKTSEFFCQRCGTALTAPQRPRVKEVRGYIQIIGTVEIVLGIIGMIVSFVGLIVTVSISVLLSSGGIPLEPSDSLDPAIIAPFLGVILGVIAIIGVSFSVVAIISGIKLMQYKNSGRIGTMIIGAFSLFVVPVGTIFGVAALYLLTKPEVEPLFL